MGAADVGQSIAGIHEKYSQEKTNWDNKDVRLRSIYRLLAWLRLAFFVGAFVVPTVFLIPWTVSFFAVFSFLFVAFLFLVWRAGNVTEERKYVGKRIELLEKELRCLDGAWTDDFDGVEFIEPDHDYAHDLDLFGKGSLFQFINRTSTRSGLLRLVHKLKNLSISSKDIQQRQKAIRELSSLNEFRQHYFALGALVSDENKKNKELDIESKPDISFIPPFVTWLIHAFGIYVLLTFLMCALGWWPSSLILYNFFAGLFVTSVYLSKVNKVHAEVSSLGSFLKRYASLIQLAEQTDFKSDYLQDVKSRLFVGEKTASEVTKKLGRLVKKLDLRLNMLLGTVINGFLLWDLFLCIYLRKWYKQYGSSLGQWLDVIHELEALNSFATFAHNHPDYIYPQIADSVIFEAEDLGHPLIPAKERISNDFSIAENRRISVVTGANMAGKSTFLRTVGVALVLAGNGCVVAASNMKYKPMLFITNMRAVDNLLNHESYFFAELSRLKMIVDRLKESGQLFFILDEILKGTNSLDKTNGSMALIRQLLELKGCGLIATHDLELGQLADQHPGQVFNNCFEVHFKNDNLSFDYKLRSGITQSHNATFLMTKMGLIPQENLRV